MPSGAATRVRDETWRDETMSNLESLLGPHRQPSPLEDQLSGALIGVLLCAAELAGRADFGRYCVELAAIAARRWGPEGPIVEAILFAGKEIVEAMRANDEREPGAADGS